MNKTEIVLPEKKLIGLQVRTSNDIEADKLNGRIFPLVQKYFQQELFNQIPERKNPGTTICAYTEYAGDFRDPYTYFIGEEVNDLNNVPEGFHSLIIPSQRYAKFTTPPQPMPQVIIEAWQKIWTMTPADFGGTRNYKTDFEIYDERASDHQRIVMDLLIGIT